MENRILLEDFSYVAFLNIDNFKSTGSWFFLQKNGYDYLITARHILYDENGSLRWEQMLVRPNHIWDCSEICWFNVRLSEDCIIQDINSDIAIINFGNIQNNQLSDFITEENKWITPVSISEDKTKWVNHFMITSDIYLVWFPTSLISRDNLFDPTKPLVTKGIISWKNNQSNTFVVDASSYYGNSGWPIIALSEDKKLYIIGFVSRYIPFITNWYNDREKSIIHTEISNSGYSMCIPIDSIIKLI